MSADGLNLWLHVATFGLLLALGLGLVRALYGPTLEDRLTSILLVGTGGVALLVLMSLTLALPALLDVALLLALLALLVTIALTRREVGRD